ncbi:MAG: hypothetical protein CMD46_02280 [Gammaproteobacteria bacterium]|nr:hypothetical protein [Gammaproteobacteria bacterium]
MTYCKNLKIIFSCLSFFMFDHIVAEEEAKILGHWLTSQSIVLINKCDDQLCATIEHVFVEEGTDPKSILDSNNKDKSLRNRSIVGINLIKDFKFQKGLKEYRGGKIYDPGRGRIFKSNIYLLENKNLKVEGCVMRLCGHEEWQALKVTIDDDGSKEAVLKYEKN